MNLWIFSRGIIVNCAPLKQNRKVADSFYVCLRCRLVRTWLSVSVCGIVIRIRMSMIVYRFGDKSDSCFVLKCE